jgi:hypothetical protein
VLPAPGGGAFSIGWLDNPPAESLSNKEGWKKSEEK